MTTRRGFLGAMLAACAAPAIVRADSLMRVIPVETDILLVPAPAPRSVAEQMQEARERAVQKLREKIDADVYQASVQVASPGLQVGDMISIAGVMGLHGGAQLFRITSVNGPSLTIAAPERPRIVQPAAPWFRQHDKRGRR